MVKLAGGRVTAGKVLALVRRLSQPELEYLLSMNAAERLYEEYQEKLKQLQEICLINIRPTAWRSGGRLGTALTGS